MKFSTDHFIIGAGLLLLVLAAKRRQRAALPDAAQPNANTAQAGSDAAWIYFAGQWQT